MSRTTLRVAWVTDVQQKARLATEITEHTERDDGFMGFFSVNSVFSDVTTSHSTMLAKDASQVAGYVAKGGS